MGHSVIVVRYYYSIFNILEITPPHIQSMKLIIIDNLAHLILFFLSKLFQVGFYWSNIF